MIFIDSNVPMYLVGGPHPNKQRLAELLRELVSAQLPLVTSIEVYQEILHRYSAIDRLPAIDNAFAWLERSVHRTLTYGMAEIRLARRILADVKGVSARDALHVAVMRSAGIEKIVSMDAGFDRCHGVLRLHSVSQLR